MYFCVDFTTNCNDQFELLAVYLVMSINVLEVLIFSLNACMYMYILYTYECLLFHLYFYM